MGAKSEGIEEMKVVMLVTAQQQLHVSLEQSIVHFSKHKYKHTHTHTYSYSYLIHQVTFIQKDKYVCE